MRMFAYKGVSRIVLKKRTGHKWTEEEKRFLEINHRSMPWQKIADHLGRTVTACVSYAQLMGLRGRK